MMLELEDVLSEMRKTSVLLEEQGGIIAEAVERERKLLETMELLYQKQILLEDEK